MILFLPDFKCIDFLCIVDAWWGMESVQGLLISQKEVEKRPNFLEMYLATAVAKQSKRGIPKYS